jgi:hypothetical protein
LCSFASVKKKSNLQAKSVYAVVLIGGATVLKFPRFPQWPMRNFFYFYHKLKIPIQSSQAIGSQNYSGGIDKVAVDACKPFQRALMGKVAVALQVLSST